MQKLTLTAEWPDHASLSQLRYRLEGAVGEAIEEVVKEFEVPEEVESQIEYGWEFDEVE